jgi:hypothetical protein
VTDQTIASIARSLAAALAQVGYTRNSDDKREVMRLQAELCAAVRDEEPAAKEASKDHETSKQQESKP